MKAIHGKQMFSLFHQLPFPVHLLSAGYSAQNLPSISVNLMTPEALGTITAPFTVRQMACPRLCGSDGEVSI